MATYKTVYARITPTNGVANEKYSVSVSGITANVDGQKTWSGNGAMNFAITPTSAGTMTVTFKNDTLKQVIGTRKIGVDSPIPGSISLPNGISSVYDTNLGMFPIWRSLSTAGPGVLMSESGVPNPEYIRSMRAVKENNVNMVKFDTYYNVPFAGTAETMVMNVVDKTATKTIKQLGSLIGFIRARLAKLTLTEYNITSTAYHLRFIKDGSAGNINQTYIDTSLTGYDLSTLTLSPENIAIFSRLTGVAFRYGGGNTYIQMLNYWNMLNGFEGYSGGMFAALPENAVPETPFNFMVLKVTGPNVVNTFTADTPYPRIINVQYINASRSGYEITGYNLTVNSALGIDLTDTNKYYLMTSIVDRTGMSTTHVGGEVLAEKSRSKNQVQITGSFMAPVEGTQGIWVAIVQMYA